MKKILLTAALAISIASCTKEPDEISAPKTPSLKSQNVAVSSLPSSLLEFTNLNFPSFPVQYAELDDNEYEVYLNNGLELSFNLQGQFLGWEADNTALAISLLPSSILDYITTNYPNSIIKEANLDMLGYEVELNADIDLHFSNNGEFLFVEMD
jgi:hypothetical protein